MRNVNKAVIRERHVMPTVDDLISALNGATTFSKMDLNSGYHQLELDEDSRQYTSSQLMQAFIDINVLILESPQRQRFSSMQSKQRFTTYLVS